MYLGWLVFTGKAAKQPNTEVRVTLALVAVGAYWILALAANWRVARITPAGIRTTMLPFPTGSGQQVPREAILHCYARYDVDTGDNDYVVDDYYSIGVETVAGRQIDLHRPFRTEALALDAAHDLARVLQVPVRTVTTNRTWQNFRFPFLLWSAITLSAVYTAFRAAR